MGKLYKIYTNKKNWYRWVFNQYNKTQVHYSTTKRKKTKLQ